MNAPIAPSIADAAAEDLLFAAIIDNLDLLSSYALSAREAAWRRNAPFVRLHLLDIRAALLDAIGDLRALERLEAAP
jgi:hypothetical protein